MEREENPEYLQNTSSMLEPAYLSTTTIMYSATWTSITGPEFYSEMIHQLHVKKINMAINSIMMSLPIVVYSWSNPCSLILLPLSKFSWIFTYIMIKIKIEVLRLTRPILELSNILWKLKSNWQYLHNEMINKFTQQTASIRHQIALRESHSPPRRLIDPHI